MSSAFAQSWSTATSTNSENGRVIIFRFIDDLGTKVKPSAQPARIILQWKYQQEAEKGMPIPKDHAQMDAMEDLLEPAVEKDGFATLALVSTGEHLREWVYYAKDPDEFLARLNHAFSGQPPFPLEIQTAQDAEWKTWKEFKNGLKR